MTMTELKRNIRNSSYTGDHYFCVSGVQSGCAHLIVVNGCGETIVDTAKGKRWRVRSVDIVFK